MIASQDQTLGGIKTLVRVGGAQVFSSGTCCNAHCLHTEPSSAQLSSAQHEILVKVDAEQAADELAGRDPPGKEGKEPSKENGGEDRT